MRLIIPSACFTKYYGDKVRRQTLARHIAHMTLIRSTSDILNMAVVWEIISETVSVSGVECECFYTVGTFIDANAL